MEYRKWRGSEDQQSQVQTLAMVILIGIQGFGSQREIILHEALLLCVLRPSFFMHHASDLTRYDFP